MPRFKTTFGTRRSASPTKEKTMPDTSVIELLIAHETALKDLYSAYAETFPMYSEFWNSVAFEENGHADLIATLKAEVESGALVLEPHRFKEELIKTMLNYLKKEKDNIAFGGMTLIQALTIAREVERSMIERRFFEVFKGDPDVLKKVLNTLEADTRRHTEKINIAWIENRANT